MIKLPSGLRAYRNKSHSEYNSKIVIVEEDGSIRPATETEVSQYFLELINKLTCAKTVVLQMGYHDIPFSDPNPERLTLSCIAISTSMPLKVGDEISNQLTNEEIDELETHYGVSIGNSPLKVRHVFESRYSYIKNHGLNNEEGTPLFFILKD